VVHLNLRYRHRAASCLLPCLSALLCVIGLTSRPYAADPEAVPKSHSLIHRQGAVVTTTEAGTLKTVPGTANARTARSLHRKLTKRPGQATLSGTSSPSPSQDTAPASQPASSVLTNKTSSENRISMATTGLSSLGSSLLTTTPLSGTATASSTSPVAPTAKLSVGSAFAGAGGTPTAAGSAGSIGRGLQRLTTQLPGLTQLVAPTGSVSSPPPPAPSPSSTPSPSPSPSPSPPPSPSSSTPAPAPSPATGSATLSWTLNSESDLAGYKIYLGTAPGLYTYPGSPIVVGVTGSYTLVGLPMGQTYYFAVSAFNSSGSESGLSSEVSKSMY
jgi:fibronectin type III domain protein